MEKRTCGLCGRRFSSGRALGGHMRSHMLFASPAAKPPFLPPGASPSSSSSSAAHGERRNGPSSNPPKILKIKMPRPEFSFTAAVDAGSAVHDGDSEAESSAVPSLPYVCPSPGRASSSASDATTEEDVARCLMMLSRDIWPGSKPEHQIEPTVGGGGPGRRRRREQPAVEGRSKYQCDTCKRVFRSYHALGGHRAGHKKMRTSCAPAAQIEGSNVGGGGVGIHECPFCDRIFSSAQALGGHKRSHLYPSASAAVKKKDTFIDLNLPAPAAAEDAELSSVSDAKLAFKWS